MGTRSTVRRVLAVASVSLWMTLGVSTVAMAYPAGQEGFTSEGFTSQSGGSACAVAEGLPPQLRKVEGLLAACAPSVPTRVPVVEPRQPVQAPVQAPTDGFQVSTALPWVAITAAFLTAIAVVTLRSRRPRAAI